MAIRGIFETVDEAPEPLREHLREVGGKFVLEVEGYVPKTALDEFRTNNRTLKKQTDELSAKINEYETRFKDVDPDEYKTLKTAQPDVQKQIADIETRLQKKYDAQFDQERQARQVAEDRFHQELIGNEVSVAMPKVGAHETAYRELKGLAASMCKIVDGKPVPHRGEEPLYSDKEPTRFMNMEELLTTFIKENPHCFKTSSGSGATTSNGIRNSRVIAANDSRAALDNLEAIATGKMEWEAPA